MAWYKIVLPGSYIKNFAKDFAFTNPDNITNISYRYSDSDLGSASFSNNSEPGL